VAFAIGGRRARSKMNFSLIPWGTLPRCRSSSSGSFENANGEFTPEDIFIHLSKLDRGVIHDRRMAINPPSSLRSPPTPGSDTPGIEPRIGSTRSPVWTETRFYELT
jgi:hypothetical protein